MKKGLKVSPEQNQQNTEKLDEDGQKDQEVYVEENDELKYLKKHKIRKQVNGLRKVHHFYRQYKPEAKRIFHDILRDKQNFSIAQRFNESIIFVVGLGGSGTTLMRAILDVSPKIDCNFETWIIPDLLQVVLS